MGLILRRNLERPLTHDELDNNLVYLDINEWQLQSYEKGMWCYIKGVDNIAAMYVCENTHNKNVYPGGVFAEVVNSIRIWRPFEGGGGNVYFENPDPSTATNLEGIPAGTTFGTPHTMQEMWDLLLYPYQPPAFTLFNFSTHNGILEIGHSFSSDTANWTTSNSSNVTANSVSIAGYNLTTVTGLTANGSTALSFSSPVTRTSKGTRSWTITGVNTHSDAFSATYSINWQWMFYWGTSLNTGLTESQIEALSGSALQTGYAGTYTYATGGYKYFCFADDYGDPTYFYDLNTGFQVAMYDGYPNPGGSGSSYALVSVTNAYGQTINYRVYRTKHILGGDLQMIIS